MTPIHELLNRIRWDQEFRRGHFEIGFLDRVEGAIHRVALLTIDFPERERRTFLVVDKTGQTRRIPFHRIREVYKDGQLIWQRAPPPIP